jgi:hypothetical protein
VIRQSARGPSQELPYGVRERLRGPRDAARLRSPPLPAAAALAAELKASLGLVETTGRDVTSIPKDSGIRPIELFMCSIIKKYGYAEGFRWLTNFSAWGRAGAAAGNVVCVLAR